MKNVSALTWLGLIFATSVAFEALAVVYVGFSEKPLVRVAILGLLFAFTVKGSRFAKYVLGALYAIGGLAALWSAVGAPMAGGFAIASATFGVFGVAASVFLFRSKVLKGNRPGIGINQ